MIIDFPNIKRKLDKIAFAHLKHVRTRERSFLNQISNHTIHEGHGQWSYQTVDNETVEQSGELLNAGFEVSFEEIKKLKIADVLNLFEKIAIEMAAKESKLAIEKISETVTESGNTVDIREKSFA